MKSVVSGALIVALASNVVLAQPSAAPPQGYPQQGPPQGYPPPGYPQQGPPPGYPPPGYPPPGYPQQYPPGYQGVPPPYGYQPQQPLTPDEQELLARGEIDDGHYFGGALASIFLGFGIGQAVQGRYGDRGWIFTLGEGASLTAVIVGAAESVSSCVNADATCDSSRGVGLLVGGVIGIFVFRIWEIADAFIAPPGINQQIREIRARHGMPQPIARRMAPYLAPTASGEGGVAGVSLSF